ncbi:MAG: hypothetical protein QM736_30055 [Vicinamibacterales bacterium]
MSAAAGSSTDAVGHDRHAARLAPVARASTRRSAAVRRLVSREWSVVLMIGPE